MLFHVKIRHFVDLFYALLVVFFDGALLAGFFVFTEEYFGVVALAGEADHFEV